MTKILMILTSHKEIEGAKDTGAWLGEFTDPYYEFIDQGYQVVLASPKGGEPPIDPRSLLTENITPSNRRFNDDTMAQTALKNTIKLEVVNTEEFDAVFFPGGHGPMWDLANDDHCARIVTEFWKQEKPIGAVCHGPAGLVKAAAQNPQMLKGKRVTAFSNMEERAVFLYDHLPFTLEDRLKELGAEYHSATIPFTARIETDGLLITGQNPASAAKAAKALIEVIEQQKVMAD